MTKEEVDFIVGLICARLGFVSGDAGNAVETVDQENRDSQDCKAREAHRGSLANGESLASRGRKATQDCLTPR